MHSAQYVFFSIFCVFTWFVELLTLSSARSNRRVFITRFLLHHFTLIALFYQTIIWNNFLPYLPPANEVWGKAMFSQASVILGGGLHPGGVCIWGGGGLLPGGVLHPGGDWADPPQSEYYGIWSMSGQYAFYWNAFLFIIKTENDVTHKLLILEWVVSDFC